ncbi:MAG: J domain-containing protein, partial [Rhodospirillaceae bacterium]|nr:J domain-containing protein [Rhodospirillaceae bacterium]
TKTSTSQDKFPGAQPTGNGAVRHCQWRGCADVGLHRAPQDQSLSDYYFFCLEHIRLYNAQWNYHEGLGPDDMELEYRSAATWDRPTWKMGERQAPGRPWQNIFDPFDLYKHTPDADRASHAEATSESVEVSNARRTLGITGSSSLEEVKGRYKELVKRYHPDANGGSTTTEDKMKTINAAYQTLRTALTSKPG